MARATRETAMPWFSYLDMMISTRVPIVHFATLLNSGGKLPGQGDAALCVENIGPGQRRKRLLFGVVMLGLSALLAALLVLLGIPRWWRLVLFFPFAAAAIGVNQARART